MKVLDRKQILMELKSVLIKHCSNFTMDIQESNADYIIDLIDYILTNNIMLDIEILNQLMEEIAVTSIYEENPQLLSTLYIFKQLKEDMEECQSKKNQM